MLETVGFLEFNSIAKGIEAADAVLKTAAVELVFSRSGCPGKYYLLFTGEVSAVQASLDAGRRTGGDHVVDWCLIPRVHPQVVRAIHMAAMPDTLRAVGVMEYFSVTASVYSADAAVKAAEVELIDVRLGGGCHRRCGRGEGGGGRGHPYPQRPGDAGFLRGDPQPSPGSAGKPAGVRR